MWRHFPHRLMAMIYQTVWWLFDDDCLMTMLYQTVWWRCFTKLFDDNALPNCLMTMLYQTVWRQCFTKLFDDNALPNCLTTMLYQTVWRRCFTKLFDDDALPNCLMTMLYQTVWSSWIIHKHTPSVVVVVVVITDAQMYYYIDNTCDQGLFTSMYLSLPCSASWIFIYYHASMQIADLNDKSHQASNHKFDCASLSFLYWGNRCISQNM